MILFTALQSNCSPRSKSQNSGSAGESIGLPKKGGGTTAAGVRVISCSAWLQRHKESKQKRDSSVLQSTKAAPMHQLGFITLTLLASFGHYAIGNRAERSIDRPYKSMLTVDNGHRWGTWGLKEMCPTGFYGAGFSVKVNILPFLFCPSFKEFCPPDLTCQRGNMLLLVHCWDLQDKKKKNKSK